MQSRNWPCYLHLNGAKPCVIEREREREKEGPQCSGGSIVDHHLIANRHRGVVPLLI